MQHRNADAPKVFHSHNFLDLKLGQYAAESAIFNCVLCELSCSDLLVSIRHSELSDCGIHQQAAREPGLVGVVVRQNTRSLEEE
jgi:hypothetical protein